MATEGKSLLGTVLTAQKLYFSEFNHFVAGDESLLLGVEPIANKYFTTFMFSGDNAGFTATTSVSGCKRNKNFIKCFILDYAIKNVG